MIGHVPGLGAVGAEVGDKLVADALRHHILSQPAVELTPWCVTDVPDSVRSRQAADLAALVEGLDPTRDRAVARALRGTDDRTDAAIRGRFASVDLDGPLVVSPPTVAPRSESPPAAAPRRTPARSSGVRGMATPGVGNLKPVPLDGDLPESGLDSLLSSSYRTCSPA